MITTEKTQMPMATVSMTLDRALCDKCGRLMIESQLNREAVIIHGARALECIDRKSCKRSQRAHLRLVQ